METPLNRFRSTTRWQRQRRRRLGVQASSAHHHVVVSDQAVLVQKDQNDARSGFRFSPELENGPSAAKSRAKPLRKFGTVVCRLFELWSRFSHHLESRLRDEDRIEYL